jgi:hypothetical protein
VHAVVNRISLSSPLDDAELAAAQSDLQEQAAQVEGLEAIHVLRAEDGDLILLIFGDDEAALDRTRDQLGNAFMRRHIIPHAAGPPNRAVTEIVLSYQRTPAP